MRIQKKAKGYIDDKHYWTKASTGYYEMMNASNDGLVEPNEKDKISYLEKMKISYSKL